MPRTVRTHTPVTCNLYHRCRDMITWWAPELRAARIMSSTPQLSNYGPDCEQPVLLDSQTIFCRTYIAQHLSVGRMVSSSHPHTCLFISPSLLKRSVALKTLDLSTPIGPPHPALAASCFCLCLSTPSLHLVVHLTLRSCSCLVPLIIVNITNLFEVFVGYIPLFPAWPTPRMRLR